MLPPIPQIALVANGEITSYQKTKPILSQFKKIIAVDGGLEHCHKMDLVPDCIMGDFDSISEETLDNFPKVSTFRYPQHKDESDLELAIKEVLNQGFQTVALFGVTGKRVDHFLYTLYLLARYPQNLIIESENEIIFCLPMAGLVTAKPGQTLSLIPLNQVVGVTTKGLKWELSNATLDQSFMSLSNVCKGDSFEVNLQSGALLCCLQKEG